MENLHQPDDENGANHRDAALAGGDDNPRRGLLRRLVESEASAGLVLMASAALALVIANSPAADTYFEALDVHFCGLSVRDWINDALMALFFLLVGLEIKRELLQGQLATWPARLLPGVAAVGGMAVPALIYVAVNTMDASATGGAGLRGWAIPSATDIAFSLGVLALLGSRVPLSLKVFLTALAILDDLGAVVIIALFYAADLSPPMLAAAAGILILLVVLNRLKMLSLWPYLVLGVALWFFVFKSGVHATIAGVLLALVIPIRRRSEPVSPLHSLEHVLQRPVAFGVLPVFGFANAGVALGGLGLAALGQPVTLGVAAGLFLGKQAGVFGTVWLAVRTGLAGRPGGASWRQVYGLALLCGIGFTMSLFVGLLAFAGHPELLGEAKIGVLLGSLLSAVAGFAVLRLAPARD